MAVVAPVPPPTVMDLDLVMETPRTLEDPEDPRSCRCTPGDVIVIVCATFIVPVVVTIVYLT